MRTAAHSRPWRSTRTASSGRRAPVACATSGPTANNIDETTTATKKNETLPSAMPASESGPRRPAITVSTNPMACCASCATANGSATATSTGISRRTAASTRANLPQARPRSFSSTRRYVGAWPESPSSSSSFSLPRSRWRGASNSFRTPSPAIPRRPPCRPSWPRSPTATTRPSRRRSPPAPTWRSSTPRGVRPSTSPPWPGAARRWPPCWPPAPTSIGRPRTAPPRCIWRCATRPTRAHRSCCSTPGRTRPLRDASGQGVVEHANANGAVRSSGLYPRLRELAEAPFHAGWPSGYVLPVPGSTISSRSAHWPNAPRGVPQRHARGLRLLRPGRQRHHPDRLRDADRRGRGRYRRARRPRLRRAGGGGVRGHHRRGATRDVDAARGARPASRSPGLDRARRRLHEPLRAPVRDPGRPAGRHPRRPRAGRRAHRQLGHGRGRRRNPGRPAPARRDLERAPRTWVRASSRPRSTSSPASCSAAARCRRPGVPDPATRAPSDHEDGPRARLAGRSRRGRSVARARAGRIRRSGSRPCAPSPRPPWACAASACRPGRARRSLRCRRRPGAGPCG